MFFKLIKGKNFDDYFYIENGQDEQEFGNNFI